MRARQVRNSMMLCVATVVGAGIASASVGSWQGAQPEITVYNGECRCCDRWVEHLRQDGFTVKVVEVSDMGVRKDELAVPRSLRACHTGVVAGYTIEGHVPAEVIRRLLAERPDWAGISVPEMPIGSPGMEIEGQDAESYDILAFDHQDNTVVYASR